MFQGFRQFIPQGSARSLVFFAALSWVISGGAAHAGGTGGDPQIFNVFDGVFTRPAAPGLCQCTSVIKARVTSCQSSAAACQTLCTSRLFAFVPGAGQSCRGGVSPTRPTS